MIEKLKITILIDDRSDHPELISEHGLSFWIEADNRRFLFDTGQSNALLQNARNLGIDLRTADAVVLSHGHYDHTGGFSSILELAPAVPVYCHPGVVMPRYSLQLDATVRSIGVPPSFSTALFKSDRVRWVSGPTHLSADIGITGPIPRISAFEDTGGGFYLDPEATKPDPIDDDLSMWFETAAGLVIITGCCHSGVVNTLTYIKKLTEGKRLHAVVGGFHLVNASPERIVATCDFLRLHELRRIGPCHCTGDKAIECMKREFARETTVGKVGDCIGIP